MMALLVSSIKCMETKPVDIVKPVKSGDQSPRTYHSFSPKKNEPAPGFSKSVKKVDSPVQRTLSNPHFHVMQPTQAEQILQEELPALSGSPFSPDTLRRSKSTGSATLSDLPIPKDTSKQSPVVNRVRKVSREEEEARRKGFTENRQVLAKLTIVNESLEEKK